MSVDSGTGPDSLTALRAEPSLNSRPARHAENATKPGRILKNWSAGRIDDAAFPERFRATLW